MSLNTDLVRNASPNFATTLANSMLISDTSMTLQSGTGLPTATAITLVIDATDPVSGAATPALKEVVTGTLSGTTVSNLVRGLDGTSAIGHASGANVVMWITANLWNDFQTSYLTQHTQLGAHQNISTNTINTTGNAVVGGTLAVTGATTLSGAIGGAGYSYATLTNPYKFSVYLNNNQTISPSTDTVVAYDTKVYDTGNNVDIVTHKGRFTAPVSGYYVFTAMVNGVLTVNAAHLVTLIKNGSLTVSVCRLAQIVSPSTNSFSIGGSSPPQLLSAGDYIEIDYYQNSAGNVALQASSGLTYFSGFLISAT